MRYRSWLLVVPTIALLCSCGTTEETQKQTSDQGQEAKSDTGDPIDAKTMADMNLKSLLKDPDSAKFRKVVVTRLSGGNLMLCGEVNSKNAFGGFTGFKRFIASPNPEAPSIIEGETPGVTKAIFREAYASACANVVERFS